MGDDLAQPVHGCGGQVGDDRVGRVADPRVGPAGLEPRGAQLLQGPVRGGGQGVDEDAEGGDVIRTNFGTALMLGIAYAASIGSLATIIGTPPNTLLPGYMSDAHDVTIGFGQWMLVGLPLAVVLLVFCWARSPRWCTGPRSTRSPAAGRCSTARWGSSGAWARGRPGC